LGEEERGAASRSRRRTLLTGIDGCGAHSNSRKREREREREREKEREKKFY
jgi:hypothetical protein